FRLADAAAAVDAFIAEGRLLAEAFDDHDVSKHSLTDAELVAEFAGKERNLPAGAVPTVRAVTRPCVVRERCRLRRLRTAEPTREASARPIAPIANMAL